jgi:hypothetical protein
MYRVSHLTWNPPRQRAAAAAIELPGNELVTLRASSWVPSYVGHHVQDYTASQPGRPRST